jgi:dTDP-4-amino-4,6-dideoxygalactose transaminase
MIGINRKTFMGELHASGIGSQVHYIPVHLQPFYRARYGELHLPGAAAYYERALTLPLFSAMTEADVDRVATAIAEIVGVH